MNIKEYLDIVKSGVTPMPQPFVTGIVGRVIRGTKPEDFETLTDDPSRIVVMLMDSDGLAKLFGKTPYKILIEIGYRGDYIQQKLDAGNKFKLAVFPASEAYPATWAGAFDVVKKIYPDLTSCCQKHGNLLSGMTNFSMPAGQVVGHFLHEIEALAGYKFADADKKDDPRFMSVDKYRVSGKSLWELRALMYHTLHMRELYSGDGWTYNEQGRRQIKEYFMINKKITDISGAMLLDMDVQAP